jgi:hypothetical protein
VQTAKHQTHRDGEQVKLQIKSFVMVSLPPNLIFWNKYLNYKRYLLQHVVFTSQNTSHIVLNIFGTTYEISLHNHHCIFFFHYC